MRRKYSVKAEHKIKPPHHTAGVLEPPEDPTACREYRYKRAQEIGTAQVSEEAWLRPEDTKRSHLSNEV